MTWRSRILLTAMLSALLALALSLLPSIDQVNGEKNGFPAFRHSWSTQLASGNLADWLARLPFELDIRKADWHEPILDIDLYIPATGVADDAVYRDLYRLTQSAFYELTNIRQVLVRIMAPDQSGNGVQLLLSMDARKEQLPKHEQKVNIGSTLELQKYLQTYCRLAYSGFWGGMFTEPRPSFPRA